MPFSADHVLQHKRSDRQRRQIHEREYAIFVDKLQRKRSTSRMSYISSEHLQDIKRSNSQRALNRSNQYKRIEHENELISQRIYQGYQRPMVEDTNRRDAENLDTLRRRNLQQRSTEYRRIDQENDVLSARLRRARAKVLTKEECDRDWQRHVDFMKKTSTYPENIDLFVTNAHERRCSINLAR